MAGITTFGVREQLRLVGWLRWRLFVNGLQVRRGKADLVSKIILGVGIGTAVVPLGPLVGLGSWYAISTGKPFILPGELWLVFVAWLLLPILIFGFGAESDPAALLRFPLRYSTFVLLAFAHGIFDPVAIGALYLLLGVLAGIAVASVGALLWAVPVLVAFAAFNLVLNRAILAWFSRWLARRRTREILGAAFLLLMFTFQLIGPLSERYGKHAAPTATRFAPAGRVLPPGMAASAIAAGHAGDTGRALADFAGLVLYGGVLAWLLSIRLRAEYRGENLSEARTEKAGERTTVRAGWSVAGLSAAVAALLEKDLRYLLRNSAQYFTLAVPLVLVVVFGLNRGNAAAHQPAFMRSGGLLFPLSVGYCLLILIGFAYNSLGFDGSGVAMLFASPVRFRDVMLAKNLLHALVVSVEILLVSALDWAVAGPPEPLLVLETLVAALFILLANFTAGNLVSLYWARKLNFGQMRRQSASGVATLVSLGIQVLMAGLVLSVHLLSRWAGSLWFAVLSFLVLAAAAFVAYRRVLDATSDIALKRRDALMSELCR